MTESTTPTSTPVKGTWSEQKSKLKVQFPILTDEDLQYENGKKDEMFARVQTKIGKTKEELDALMTGL